MPTVQPPPPPSPPSSALPQPGQAVAVAVKAPAALSQLRPGQSVQATQVPQAPQAASATQPAPSPTQSLPANLTQVQTTLGPITLQTTLPIPKGAVLTLLLNQLSPQPQFLITEINGKPVPAAQLGPSPQSANRVSAPPLLAEGARLSASLVRPALSVAPSAPQALTPQASGQPQVLTPTHVPPPSTPPPPGAAALPSIQATQPGPPTTQPPPLTAPAASAAPQGNTQATAPSASTGAAQHIQLPTGTRFTVSIVRIASPSTALNSATPVGGGLTAGAMLNGTVSGTTPQGQPIVQTSHATIALDTTAKIGDGMRVALKLESAPILPSTPDAAKLGRTGPAETLAQARSWPHLDEALKALAQADPARFQHVAHHLLPQSGAKLTSQMLFFLSALKGGDIKAWLGDSVTRTIERDRPGITNRLGGDFRIMSKLVDEPQSGDWRLALIPLWSGKEIEQLRMYYRNRSAQDDENGDGDGTRFVLDIELNNIGHVQIDGLMKSATKKLDLIVRTDEPLPEVWRTDIAEIFVAAQDITGIGGGLAFQAAPGNFAVFPPMESPSPHPGLFA